jgi:hypothetical protein
MKTKFARLTVAALLLSGACTLVQADDSPNASKRAEVQTVLAGLSLSDAVKTSAGLVSAASEADRQQVASAVLQVMARTHADALPQVAGAISAKTPELAGFVAAQAVQMRPDQAADITKDVVKADSKQAADIVEFVLYQNPSLYQVVGVAAMDAAPDKSSDILRSISLITLDLKANIDQALVGNPAINATKGKTVLLQGIQASQASTKAYAKYQPLDMAGCQATNNTSAYGGVVPSASVAALSKPASSRDRSTLATPAFMPAPTFMPAPSFTAPPVPLPASPIESGVSQTQPEPPGGRTYSSP